MGSIITTYSSVASYINSTSGEYSSILTRANEIRSRVEKLYNEVQMDLESITRQIMRGQRMLDEIQLKVDKYQALMEDARAEVDRCDAEISYVLNHPITRTYTDDDGDSYTVEEIDEAALAAAERARDRAYDEYERYRKMYNEATSVKYEVSATVSRFETIKSGIEKIAQMIQSDIYEIQKYINAIENESEYNLRNLNGISDSLSAYLASKAINMPIGTVYSDYSATGGLSGNMGASASGSSVLSEVAATTDDTVASNSYSGLAGSSEDSMDAEHSGDDVDFGSIIMEYGAKAIMSLLCKRVGVDPLTKASLTEQARFIGKTYGPHIMESIARVAIAQHGAPLPTLIMREDELGIRGFSPKNVSERYFNKYSKRDAKSLSFSESKHLQTYLNDNDLEPAYRKINGHLVKGDSVSEDLLKTIDSMTETLSNHTLKRDMVLYRGMKRDTAEKIFGKMEGQSIEELKSRLEGTTYIERGFSSTSILEKDALNYSGYKGVLFEINAPCGAEGIFTGSLAHYANAEHEVLLQRGGIFTVNNVSDRGDYYVVNVTLEGRALNNE